MNNNDENKNSKISNLLINIFGIILLLSIILLITISFIKSKYPFEITGSIIILLAFLLVIFLSKSFDDFQIGRIISLKRNVTEYREKNEKLENDKNELIKQIVTMNVQLQQKMHNEVNIQIANAKEIKEKELQENSEQKDNKIIEQTKNKNQKIDLSRLEKIAIKKYIGEIDYDSILQNVKLENKSTDENMKLPMINMIFDGYYKDNEKESFIEVKRQISYRMNEQIYAMLSQIDTYNKIKNAKARLDLIIVTTPDDGRIDHSRVIDRLKERFVSAITSGLLKIVQIDISNEEMKEIYI